MARALGRDPHSPTVPTLVVLVAATAGWVAVVGLHALLMATPETAALAALPPAVRSLVRFCGSHPALSLTGAAGWLAGWTLMVAAMMLPPALPLLRAAERLFAGRDDAANLLALAMGAFLAAWVAAGAALFALGSLARLGLGALPDHPGNAQIAAGLAAILAGLFQFTPLKTACMDACRSPTGVMMVAWRAGTPRRSALRIGGRYGAICVGCCWAMMILGVLVGALMLAVMVVCAVLMTLERLLPAFRPLIPVQAAFAIAVGMALLFGAIPPAFL